MQPPATPPPLDASSTFRSRLDGPDGVELDFGRSRTALRHANVLRRDTRCLAPPMEPPRFALTDKQVLRFYAYTKDGIPDSALERVRVRQVAIHLHVATGEMELSEPAQHNSGLVQGIVVRRAVIPLDPSVGCAPLVTPPPTAAAGTGSPLGTGILAAASQSVDGRVRAASAYPSFSCAPTTPLRGTWRPLGKSKPLTAAAMTGSAERPVTAVYTWEHLAVGAELLIYGRVYRVVDADAFTRTWYAANGVEVAPAEEVPVGDFEAKLATAAAAEAAAEAAAHHRSPEKLYYEALRGRFTRDPEARRKFQVSVHQWSMTVPQSCAAQRHPRI